MRGFPSSFAVLCLLVAPQLAAQSGQASVGDSAHAALVVALKEELHRLLKAQDAYLAQHDTYTSVLPRSNFEAAPGHEVAIATAGNKGYSATVTGAQEPGLTCGLYVGSGTAPNAAIFKAREPACWRPLPNGSLSAE